MMPRPTNPPTTPPAIGPTLDFLDAEPVLPPLPAEVGINGGAVLSTVLVGV
jgi:hypothetical protein